MNAQFAAKCTLSIIKKLSLHWIAANKKSACIHIINIIV
jgi:hypothetical protein